MEKEYNFKSDKAMRRPILFIIVIVLQMLFASAQSFAQSRLVGGDLSLVPAYEAAGDQWLDENGSVIPDLLAYVKEKGWNAVRMRLFVDPSQDASDPSVCQDFDYVLALAQRVKNLGMKVCLDLHYSDTWADPGQQKIPSSWTDHSNAALSAKVYSYTNDVIKGFIQGGAAPEYVQIGNEITYGLLWTTTDGKYPQSSSQYASAGYCPTWSSNYSDGTSQWKRTASLLNNASHAVHQAFHESGIDSTLVQIVLHTTMVGTNASSSLNFHKHLRTAGFTNYDIIGFSYYPFWNGRLEVLGSLLTNLRNTFPEKPVHIVETAWYNNWYPYSKDASGEYTIASLNSNWTANAQGQVNYLNDLVDYVQAFDNVKAVYYWMPEECGNGYQKKVMNSWINRGLWNNSSSQKHAMLKASDGSTGVSVLARFLGDEDGIEEVKTTLPNRFTYDLSGRRTKTPVRGVRILNGRKILNGK